MQSSTIELFGKSWHTDRTIGKRCYRQSWIIDSSGSALLHELAAAPQGFRVGRGGGLSQPYLELLMMKAEIFFAQNQCFASERFLSK